MKPLSIFRVGTHTTSDGTKITFSSTDMQGLIDSYNPELHEAPIVIGHPRHDAPAYGWIKGLASGENNSVIAEPAQMSSEFEEWVKAGHYKKRSASLYPPDHPDNPSPGNYYLRHLGFLGAQPPALKGMPDANFGEAETGLLEFADPQWTAHLLARIVRGLREWMIAKEGLDEADKIIPGYAIEDLEAEAREPAPATEPAPGFAEGTKNQPPGDITVTEDEKKLKAAQDKLAADQTAFAEKQKDFAEAQQKTRVAALGVYATKLAKSGHIPAATAPEVADFMANLPQTIELEFGEGDKAKKVSMEGWFKNFLESRPATPPKQGPSAGDGGEGGAGTINAHELRDKALAYQEAKKQAGITVDIVAAVAAVQAGETA